MPQPQGLLHPQLVLAGNLGSTQPGSCSWHH
jgi:hypothetical protein